MKKGSWQPPKTFVMAGHRITIKYDLSNGDWGNYDRDDRVLSLCPSLLDDRAELKKTFFHEMLHVAFALTGMWCLKRFEEEAVVRCLEDVFFPAWEKFRVTNFPDLPRAKYEKRKI